MTEPAFTAGVRPGGLTDETQIRILICYLVQNFSPVTQQELNDTLCGAQLVNYFELYGAIADLCRLGHLLEQDDGYHISSTGAMTANDLTTAVPRSVRERAFDAMLKLRSRQLKVSQNRAEIQTYGSDCLLRCKIDDLGRTLLDLTLTFPDLELAEHARRLFVENGSAVYQLLVAGLTQDKALAQSFFEQPDEKEDGSFSPSV